MAEGHTRTQCARWGTGRRTGNDRRRIGRSHSPRALPEQPTRCHCRHQHATHRREGTQTHHAGIGQDTHNTRHSNACGLWRIRAGSAPRWCGDVPLNLFCLCCFVLLCYIAPAQPSSRSSISPSLPLPLAASLSLLSNGGLLLEHPAAPDLPPSTSPPQRQKQHARTKRQRDGTSEHVEVHDEHDGDASQASSSPSPSRSSHPNPNPAAIAGATGISQLTHSRRNDVDGARSSVLLSVAASLQSVAEGASAADTPDEGDRRDLNADDASDAGTFHHDDADDAGHSADHSVDDETHWSLRLLRHATLCVSLLLLMLGTLVWLWGHRIFLASAPTCCAFMLAIWSLAVGDCLVGAWTAENGMAKLTMAPSLDNSGSSVGGRGAGLDITTAGGVAALAALTGVLFGVAFVGWLFACSRHKRHAGTIVALVWGTCLGSLLHISAVAWLLDTSNPITLEYAMHMSLVLCIVLCSALTVLHSMHGGEKSVFILSTAGVGAWSVVRGAVMLILLIEAGSDNITTTPADGDWQQQQQQQTLEMEREWKWPNEWNPPLLDRAHPGRVLSYDSVSSDPSFASSVPYSSLASSVTQDDIRLNVRPSYYAYLALMLLCFLVGVAVQSARQRRRMALNLAHFNQTMSLTATGSAGHSRRNSSLKGTGYSTVGKQGTGGANSAGLSETAHLLAPNNTHTGGGSGGKTREFGRRVFSEVNFLRASGGYGSTADSRSAAGGNGQFRRASLDDLSTTPRGGGGGSGAGSIGRNRTEFVKHEPRNTRSVSVSPLRSALVVRSLNTPSKDASSSSSSSSASSSTSSSATKSSSSLRKAPSGQDWSRRTSFTLNINVGATDPFAQGAGLGRSPSAPALSSLEADLLHVPYSVPAGSVGSSAGGAGGPGGNGSGSGSVGGSNNSNGGAGSGSARGSLKKMRAAALALKGRGAVVAKAKKKSLTFMDEISGLAVAPQRTPEPPVENLQRRQQHAAIAATRGGEDVSAGSGIDGVSLSPYLAPLRPSPDSGSLVSSDVSSSVGGGSSVTPVTPAWSPYPLVTQQHIDEWREQERHAENIAQIDAEQQRQQRQRMQQQQQRRSHREAHAAH